MRKLASGTRATPSSHGYDVMVPGWERARGKACQQHTGADRSLPQAEMNRGVGEDRQRPVVERTQDGVSARLQRGVMGVRVLRTKSQRRIDRR